VEQIVFATNGTTVMTTTKGYDFVNRLTNTVSLGGTGATLSQFDYRYNTAGQRTSVTNLDGSYWVYGYDSMGQVTSGKKYWSDGTPVAGQQFDYAFDDIGNRQTTMRDLRQASYSVNSLNQYTSRDVPGFVNVLGTATNTATVSLWSQDNLALYTPTTRKGDYFRGEMLVNNNTGALWLTITNVAVLSNYTGADIVTNIAGNLLLAKNPEAFTYDADGNLTSDSLWTNVWNGENRRITVESRSTLPAAAKVKEAWTILADGRWIERIVSTNNGTSYYPSQTNRYVWDHQVLLAVLDHTNGVLVSFMRGIDMSGSIQGAGGAGGVGGVLAVQVGPAGPAGLAGTTHFTCYDGNGNVTALVNAATGAESARYAYGPFAEPLQRTGPMAKLNPVRFSTQYHDDSTEDDKYVFRDLSGGRWPNRDPIGELGFRKMQLARLPRPSTREEQNLYGFVGNSPVSKVDSLGLKLFFDCTECGPDVTRNVDRALLRAELKFWQADQITKHNACASLYDVLGIYFGSGGAMNAWDITDVYEAGATPGRLFETSCGFTRGRGKCADGLTFRGGCYHASAINYAMWGRMHKACGEASALYGWEEDYSLGTANRWAFWMKWGVHGDRRWSMTDQVLMFVEYGYNGNFAGGSTTQLPCSPNKCKATGEFGWHWRGLN